MNNRTIALVVLATAVAMPAMAKKAPVLTGLELQQIQSRDFEAPKDVSFAAVMTVLQDAGYRINAADRDTGLITGTASSESKMIYSLWSGFGKSKKTPIVSAYIESRGATNSRVRLNFVLAKIKSSIYGSQPQDEEPIIDTAIYQGAFEKINQAVFVRQAMDAPATTPAAAATPVVASTSVAPMVTATTTTAAATPQ
jgi:hypothetical protein